MLCISGMNWDVGLNVNSSLLIFSRLVFPLGIFSTAVFLSSSGSSCFINLKPFFNSCHDCET